MIGATLLDEKESPGDAELAERVVRMGRNGLGRAEIAAAVGMGLAALARMETREPWLAAALQRAGDAEQAWWEALPREALTAGARFNAGAWSAAMRWRFGAAGDSGAAAGPGADAPARPRAIYLLPDNCKERRAPDGTPMTPELRRARAVAQVQGEIDRLEAQLRERREELSEVDAADYRCSDDPDADEDDSDEAVLEEGGAGRGADDDEIDCDEGENGDGDDDESDFNGDSGGVWRGYRGRSPHPLGRSIARVAAPTCIGAGDGGADGVSGLCAGCERAVPAGRAGAATWAAQPGFGPGGPRDPAGLRG